MATIVFHPVRLLTRACVAAAVLAGVAGCGGTDAGESTVAQVRVMHVSPDSPGLDVYQDETGIAYGLTFGTMTSYVELPAGAFTLSAASAGTGQQFATSRQAIAGGKQYTAIIGNVAAGIEEMVLEDRNTPVRKGRTGVRLVNEATRAGGPVDIYLVAPGGTLLTTTPFLANVNFGVHTGYIEIASGTYALMVVPAGTATIATTATLLTGAQLIYASGATRTIVLVDKPGSLTSLQAMIVDDFVPGVVNR